MPSDRGLNGRGITHAESCHILHLKGCETVFEIMRLTPIVSHVLSAQWEDKKELCPRAERRSQQFPVVNVPFLRLVAAHSHTSMRIDWGKAEGALGER